MTKARARGLRKNKLCARFTAGAGSDHPTPADFYSAPLVDALLAHRGKNPVPFHMPGGKGRALPLEGLGPMSAFDVTELPDTGNLYEGHDVIAQAEALWAAAFGFPICQFLTGGSTQGLQAALLLSARSGREVLADRCSHRSVFNAFALFDLSPSFFLRRQDTPVDPELLEAALAQREQAGKPVNTVCVTSPTYYGVLSDIPALAKVAHRHGAKLMVDGAHGAHLPFLGQNPFEGADLLVCSAHKTLPVYGQGALLFAGSAYSPKAVRHAASVVGTSSPSYPIMASMDAARVYLESREGQLDLLCVKSRAAKLRARFGGLGNVTLDPLRLTLEVADKEGFALKERLEREGIFPEMADADHVVFLFSTANTREDFDRLENALERWYVPGPVDRAALPPAPEQVVSPKEALTAPREGRILAESENFVCAQQVAPYPPGIPVIAPGERITKKCLAYLADVGYNVHQEVDVLLEAPDSARKPGEP